MELLMEFGLMEISQYSITRGNFRGKEFTKLLKIFQFSELQLRLKSKFKFLKSISKIENVIFKISRKPWKERDINVYVNLDVKTNKHRQNQRDIICGKSELAADCRYITIHPRQK